MVDDLRLLWLEVAVKGQEKPKVCKLPAELLPTGRTEGNTEELGPGEALVHRLDPRFYCFSPDKQETLVPSAQVTPHYGWPSKTKRVYRKGRVEEEKAEFSYTTRFLDWWDYWINIHIPALRRWTYPLIEGRPLEARPARNFEFALSNGEAVKTGTNGATWRYS